MPAVEPKKRPPVAPRTLYLRHFWGLKEDSPEKRCRVWIPLYNYDSKLNRLAPWLHRISSSYSLNIPYLILLNFSFHSVRIQESGIIVFPAPWHTACRADKGEDIGFLEGSVAPLSGSQLLTLNTHTLLLYASCWKFVLWCWFFV
jgi:hypothetical protein